MKTVNKELSEVKNYHNNCANNSHGLKKLLRATIRAPWNQSFSHIANFWLDNSKLISKCHGHRCDEQAKEQLQLSQSILVEKQECECVENRDARANPDWNGFCREQVDGDCSSNDFLHLFEELTQ